jgi:hypothetical protein
MNYVDSNGRCIKLVDRTQGIPLVVDTIRLLFKKLSDKVESIKKSVLPRQNATGTYICRHGKLIKLVERVNVKDIWISKHGLFPDQGEREQHNHFVNLAQRGELNDVQDRNVWEPLRRKYGRDKVRVM